MSRRLLADRTTGDERGLRRLREWDREYQLMVSVNSAGSGGAIAISDITGLQEALDDLQSQIDNLQDQIDAITGTTHYLTLVGGGRLALADGSGFLRMDLPVGR